MRFNYPVTETIVRGGTDGSLLTEKGLPTPNLPTGQHNLHSPLEWACLEEMSQAATRNAHPPAVVPFSRDPPMARKVRRSPWRSIRPLLGFRSHSNDRSRT